MNMKNKLLITTALVALTAVTNAYALEITEGDNILQNAYNEDLIISGGNNSVEDTFVAIGSPADEKNLTIKGGTTTLTSSSLNSESGTITMSDGTINLEGNENSGLWAAKDINISGGTINMNGLDSSIDTFYDLLDGGEQLPAPETPGNINITGGTINVNGANGEISTEGKINISNAEINIASKSTLASYSNDDKKEKGTFLLGSGANINLSGTLLANVNGAGNVNFKTSSSKADGNITGSNLTFEADHSLSKAISGTIGDLTSLNINKGTLTYDKQTGKIGNLNVVGGLDIGTNTVNATKVDFKENSTLKFTIAGKEDGSYGKIKADTINVSNTGTKLDLTLNSSVLAKDEAKDFTILDGSVTGDFAELSENSRYKFEKIGNGVYKITGTATASDTAIESGGTANNAGTATAWDSVSLDNPSGSVQGQVANVLAELSNNTNTTTGKKAYINALTAVAPEVAPMVQQTQSETANQVFGAVGTRLTGGSVSTGAQGMSSGDNIFKRGAMWVQGMFNKSKLDDTSKAKGVDADSNGIATYGWSDYSEDKNVAGVGVKADYDVETFGLQAMTGYDMNINGFGVTPEAGLRYVHIKQDAYKDSADQKVSGNDSDILTGVIGAKVSKFWELENGMNIKPEVRVAATYDLMNDDVNSVVTLANGSAYAVEGEALDRFGMEFGAGVTAEVNDNVELSLGYEGKFREDYQDHTGLINAKYKF